MSHERVIFWEEQQALIVADLHFAKTGHFRKAGIAVPQNVYKEDLQRFFNSVQHFRPKKIIAIGDLFHSRANSELEWFRKWRVSFESTEFILVKGNHDILAIDWYSSASITVVEEKLVELPFSFTHDQCDETEYFNFCGHLHPGILINGQGRQSLRFPCFYFDEHRCILPAFSRFTGLALVNPSNASAVYAVVEKQLLKLH